MKAIEYVNEMIDDGYCPYSEEKPGADVYTCFFLEFEMDKENPKSMCGLEDTLVSKLQFENRCTLQDMKHCHFTSPVDYDRIKGGKE